MILVRRNSAKEETWSIYLHYTDQANPSVDPTKWTTAQGVTGAKLLKILQDGMGTNEEKKE